MSNDSKLQAFVDGLTGQNTSKPAFDTTDDYLRQAEAEMSKRRRDDEAFAQANGDSPSWRTATSREEALAGFKSSETLKALITLGGFDPDDPRLGALLTYAFTKGHNYGVGATALEMIKSVMKKA